jgi:hypothetical protein
VSENRVLRKVFRPRRDEGTGEWGEIACGVSGFVINYYSVDEIKRNEMGAACGTYGGEVRCIQGFGEETWGKETTWKT